jgi:amino acid adenylation domain-containing protein
VATTLRQAGISRGDLVAIYGRRSAELVWGVLGVLRAGAAFVILNPDQPSARVADSLRLASPRAWLETPGCTRTGEIADVVDGSNYLLRVTLSSDLRHLSATPGESGLLDSRPDDLAYVAFTSGTTGGLKGIQGTREPLTHFLSWHVHTFALGPEDRFSMLSGLGHDPLLRDMFTPFCVGATLCIPNPDDTLSPSRLREWMLHQRVTVAHLTPSLARILTEEATQGSIPSLRYAFFGGEILTRDLVRRMRAVAPAITIVNFYGTTETPQAMGWYVVPDADQVSDPLALPDIPIGTGIDGVQLLVLSKEGRLAGIGELGEIAVRTPYLTLGYLNDQALTRERFIANPLTDNPDDRVYRTGDLGRFRPDGILEFCGRRNTQVKIRGFRVELGEIEAALVRHPNVRQAVVVAREDSRGDKQLVGYVVGENGLTARALRDELTVRLPDYMVPSVWVFLDRFPLTPNGKVDLRGLPDPDAQSSATNHYVAPRTPGEESLAAIWREVLKIDQVGVEDNFFDLGGHSLLVMQIVSRVERALDVAMPIRSFFELPTIAALAVEVDRQRSQGHATHSPIGITAARRSAHRVRATVLDPPAGKEHTR